MITNHKLKNRDIYLDKLISFQDTEPVKIITGIRRCGKSSLLKLMIQHLKNHGIKDNQIIEMNFESHDFKNMSSDDVYDYVKNHKNTKNRTYLFFDEIQRISGWEEAVNSFRVDFDCDIYITGSNSYLLSSEYSTYLSGRYIELKMLPLSFSEFLYFNDFEVVQSQNLLGKTQKEIIDKNKKIFDLKEAFDAYLHFGGMPGIPEIGLDQEKALSLLDGIYSTVVIRDILEREKRKGEKTISDALLLRKIILFLADNIGNSVSINSVGNALSNSGLLTQQKNKTNKLSAHTVATYINALLESYFFYEIKRFDIKGKEYLKTLGKYYIVDIGLHNYLLGFRNRDRGHILENIIYFELLRRGYDVAIGKIDNIEIDFIATKPESKTYIQVTETLNNKDVLDRELKPLKKVNDNYEKIILTLDTSLNTDFDGIKAINIIDWLIS